VAVVNVLGSSESAELDDVANDEIPTFSLEYQLRDFLAQNLSAISVGGKRVKLYVDSSGKDGVEYPTAVGPIDILGVDDNGIFYVFELKWAASPDSAVG
jgi:RecB family endonuclease NucS